MVDIVLQTVTDARLQSDWPQQGPTQQGPTQQGPTDTVSLSYNGQVIESVPAELLGLLRKFHGDVGLDEIPFSVFTAHGGLAYADGNSVEAAPRSAVVLGQARGPRAAPLRERMLTYVDEWKPYELRSPLFRTDLHRLRGIVIKVSDGCDPPPVLEIVTSSGTRYGAKRKYAEGPYAVYVLETGIFDPRLRGVFVGWLSTFVDIEKAGALVNNILIEADGAVGLRWISG